MSKMPTLFEVISRPPSMKEAEIVKEMNRRIKKFDKYEESEQTEFFRCNHCNPDANLFPGDEIFWDDEHGWLCGRCLEEEEEAREAIEDEKKLHDKGSL